MAERARLVAPPRRQETWPWHELEAAVLPVALLSSKDRRFEAESYLGDGFGIRLAIQAKASGWQRMSDVAGISQPNRLKGTVVSPKHGEPYLAATQVLDFRPVGRKWLAVEKIRAATALRVRSGQILVTRSGAVGKAIVTFAAHLDFIVSDDLLRVEPKDPKDRGWVYAFLRCQSARKMMVGAHYGHVIKHLETGHLDAVPIPSLEDSQRAEFAQDFDRLVEQRSRAYELTVAAEAAYASAVGPLEAEEPEPWFKTSSQSFAGKSPRLDASYHSPIVRRIYKAIEAKSTKLERLEDLVESVLVPGRFKHVYGDQGIPYLDSADILECGPEIQKKVLSIPPEKRANYSTTVGELLMPCSGQIHGNIGHVVLAAEFHEGKILSNHILRIAPKAAGLIPMGYLQVVLGHPELGRPLVLRNAFGSSVPEIAPDDIGAVLVPRFPAEMEEAIDSKMKEAARFRSEADELEEAMSARAEHLISQFLSADPTFNPKASGAEAEG